MSKKIHTKTKNICLICCCLVVNYEEYIYLHKTRRQTHVLCIDCGVSYLTPIINQMIKNLKNGIKDETLFYVKCPGSYNGLLRNHCNHVIEIHDVGIPDHLEIYFSMVYIFYILYSKDNIYICLNENCDKLQKIDKNSGNTEFTCESCSYNWCYICNSTPYHKNKTCIEYELEQDNTETGVLLREKIKNGIYKHCPVCKTITEKETNENGNYISCNKIVCSNCNVKWCWICKEKEISYSHYNSMNSNSSCSNKLWEGTEF